MKKTDLTLLITVASLLLLIVGVSLFGIRPFWGRLTDLQQEQRDTAEELKELEERANTLGQLAKDTAEIEELGDRALTYLPTAISASQFVMDIAAIGGQASTNVPTMTFQPSDLKKAKGASFTEYPITMLAEGSFDQVHTFLRLLEDNLRFSTYPTVVISRLEDRLSLQLTGAIFSKPEDKNPKDKSLSIDNSMRDLLTAREAFGAGVNMSGAGREDPFAE